ncbi:12356_t:CDS:2 [Ambispora leptoticha]|uniref:12356_t:CDS:1 n=1 Tax=Ambispora leptoticha TaxID=144679 RepID=A0A9N8W8C1_9GLOM|nr:12356_t:CDS:2 [Ambispora leptoticha]
MTTATRRSGLQQSVINLYRDCCRAVHKKPPETRARFQAFVRAQFRRPDITSKDHAAIEYLLRRGKKQLEAYSGENEKGLPEPGPTLPQPQENESSSSDAHNILLLESLAEGISDHLLNGHSPDRELLASYIRSLLENADASTQGAPPASHSFMRNLPVVPKSEIQSESDDPEWINKKKQEMRIAAAAIQDDEEEDADWMYI